MRSSFVSTLLLAGGLLLAAATQATDLADKPLANSTTVPILPNIMLDMDNSGSMAWDYMPDYVRYLSYGTTRFVGWCRATDGTLSAVCEQGDPPYNAPAFNKMYYNPNVRYQWPVNPDGSRKLDGLNRTAFGKPWSTVPSDGYQAQKIDKNYSETQLLATRYDEPCHTTFDGQRDSGNMCDRAALDETIDLAKKFPERRWCNRYGNDCRAAVVGKNYSYPDSTNAYLGVVYGAPFYYLVTVQWCDNRGRCQDRKTSTYSRVSYSEWQRVDIVPGAVLPKKGPARTDCKADICTYEEEMENFAIWYAWYRTRAQMAKSSIGLALADVRGKPKTGAALLADPSDASYFHARVGLTTIDASIKLSIDNFEGDQKKNFFNKLYDSVPSGSTPLRSSLNSVGRMYAGKNNDFSDPVQYACQRNFAILTTDGYWNDSGSGLGGSANLDGSDASDTLADVAWYYYNTDLRDTMENIVPPTGSDAKLDDVATHQHMTTFTVGLGVDGTLPYLSDYKTAKSGAYYDIMQGTKSWPSPTAGSQETIDDLWHAAVNGRGTYFSAKDPQALQDGLRKALGSMERSTGSGAAAATSNLQPTAGDNYIYIANYRTQLWDGELSAYSVNLDTGVIGDTAQWQASAALRPLITNDTRKIWTSDSNRNLVAFSTKLTPGLSATQKAWFDNSKLSQYGDWNQSQRAAATAESMVEFLRGQDVKFPSSDVRMYRERDKALGDFVHSQPVYVKSASYDFTEAGYAGFKQSVDSRLPTVYAAANDGMLHAFDAETGAERWAYVPPMVLPDMWQLANADYESRHRFYVDGPLAVNDANINGWKTVLIGALGKGGRGYYALDITDPTAPKVLWTFSAENNPNVGYSYGTPFITKVKDQWVALLTSGYNNVPENGKYGSADGRGRLFVLKLATGEVLKTIDTGAGAVDDPSGLARINVAVDDFKTDNSASVAYGGDLKGTLWRFDLEAGTATRLLELGKDKPITAAPEISTVNKQRAVFVASGRYLGPADLSTKDEQVIAGVRDDGSGKLVSFDALVKQSLAVSGNAIVSKSKQTVKWDSTQPGWTVSLPDSGERVAVDLQLYFGTLLASSVVPAASACQPGGYSWLYQIDFATGGFVKQGVAVATRQSAPIVGITVSKLPNGTPIIHAITADGKKPNPNKLELSPPGGATNTRRVLWRELGN